MGKLEVQLFQPISGALACTQNSNSNQYKHCDQLCLLLDYPFNKVYKKGKCLTYP
jgi:hypothetical protein